MDLNSKESVINALEGVTYLLHVASPIGITVSYDDYIKPVIAGATSVIEGAKKHKLKKIIVTLSTLTIYGK